MVLITRSGAWLGPWCLRQRLNRVTGVGGGWVRLGPIMVARRTVVLQVRVGGPGLGVRVTGFTFILTSTLTILLTFPLHAHPWHNTSLSGT